MHKTTSGQHICLTPGTVFCKGEEIQFNGRFFPPFPQKALEDFIKNEFVSPLDFEYKEDPNKDIQEFRPGENPTPLPLPGASSHEKEQAIPADKAIITGGTESRALRVEGPATGIKTSVTPPPAEKVTQQTSIWDIDPETLKGKDIETLNIMILEKDSKVTPVATVEEAIGILSKDFKTAQVS